MTRINICKENMNKLGIEENNLTTNFSEFEEIKNRFIYGEVWNMGKMEDKLRMILTIAVMVTLGGDGLEEQFQAALKIGVNPDELQEIFHQTAPYIGFLKAEKGLEVLGKVFEEKGIKMPVIGNSTVAEDTRMEEGIKVQKSIFGEVIDNMRANAPEDQKYIQDYLSAYCFGDTYTRKGIDMKTRELITFVCIAALGGCEGQVKAHVMGNIAVGNTKQDLFEAMNQSMPYIGFPRTLNAIAAINEVAK